MPVININSNTTLNDVLTNDPSTGDNPIKSPDDTGVLNVTDSESTLQKETSGFTVTSNPVTLTSYYQIEPVSEEHLIVGSAMSFNGNPVATTDYVDDKITQTITNGDTTHTPSGDAVFDALANKQPLDADLTSWASVTRASGFDAFVATPNSANLAALITDEGTAFNKNFGTGSGTVCEGNDSRLSDSRYVKMLGYNWTPGSGTNTTSEELISSFAVAASQISANDYMEFYCLFQWSGSGSKTFKIYWSPTNSLSDVNKAQIAQAQATTNTGTPMTRRFVVKSNTTLRAPVPATSNVFIGDLVTAGANVPTDITVPSLSAGGYILISGTKGTGTDANTADNTYLMKRTP